MLPAKNTDHQPASWPAEPGTGVERSPSRTFEWTPNATNWIGRREEPRPEKRKAVKPYENRGLTAKCERQDLNLHGLPHWILSPARLPIPPLSRGFDQFSLSSRGGSVTCCNSCRRGRQSESESSGSSRPSMARTASSRNRRKRSLSSLCRRLSSGRASFAIGPSFRKKNTA